jgi:hypothetical protein
MIFHIVDMKSCTIYTIIVLILIVVLIHTNRLKQEEGFTSGTEVLFWFIVILIIMTCIASPNMCILALLVSR